MALRSLLFRGDPKLKAAATSDPGHIVPGARGPHVSKIQTALIQLDGADLKGTGIFGPKTAAAVRAFKKVRGIYNHLGKIDDIVGKKTMAALDEEMASLEESQG